jgi:Flp pilus assembly protein TadB
MSGGSLMWLGAIYCTVFVAVAVWIALMLFTRRSGRPRWSERYQNRLQRELDAITRRATCQVQAPARGAARPTQSQSAAV